MAIEDVVNNLGRATVVAIRYGAWGSDDYNINNPTDNLARVNYYGQGTGTPMAWVDGGNHMVGSAQIPAQTLGHVNNRLAIPSPYELKISFDPAHDSVFVKVKCTAAPPAGNKYLRIAMIEKMYEWPSPPGTNGQTHYENCLLDMVPNATGTLLNIAVGDSQLFSFAYNSTQVNFHPPAFLEALYSAVAFIQNDQDKEVLQAGYSEVGPIISTIAAGALITNSSPTTLSGYVYNNARSSINVDIGLIGNIPSGWNVTASCALGSIPINSGTSTFALPEMDTLYYDIDINPQGISGGLILDALLSLTSNPSLTSSVSFSATTNDVEILVVDAESENAETYSSTSLSNVYSGSYGIVNRSALNQSGLDLSNFDIIVWVSGSEVPAFFQEEITNLQTYLDNGGRLFISGQDIGSDIFEPSGQSQFAQSFYNNYLHAEYLTNHSNWLAVQGMSGDPITAGISFVVPYSNQLSLEAIAPYDASATSILKYTSFTPQFGAIKATTGTYRIVYSGIGFEQIPDAADRDSIMARSIRWLNVDLTAIEPKNNVPFEFALQQNYPNPFNPGTYISYTIAEQSEVEIKIYDNLGQEVRTLVNNITQNPQQYSIYWNGKDNFGKSVTSGVYYYRLISKNNSKTFEQSRKMLLIK